MREVRKRFREGDPVPSVNHVVLHDFNTGMILRTIQESGPISRSEIAEHTSLAQSTVSVITGELRERGFVRECGRATSTIGRRRVLLEMNPDGGHFVCADLSQSDLQIGVLNLALNIKQEWTYPVSARRGEALYNELEHALTLVMDWCREQAIRVFGIGVSTPGLVDGPNGRVIEANNLDWYDLDIGLRLKRTFHCEVVIENDTNAAAFGEYKYGDEKAQNLSNMMYVSVWSGIGSGLVFGGNLYSGSKGMAGEIGHVMVDAKGPRCTCGKRGCLESFASSASLVREYVSKVPVGTGTMTAEMVLALAQQGDTAAFAVVRHAGLMVGLAVGNQVNVLNVDSIVVDGLLASANVMWEPFTEGLQGALLPKLRDGLALRRASLGRDAALIGVASLHFERMVNLSGLLSG